MIQTTVTMILLVFGGVLMLLAGFGLLRMPDVFLRMSASAKAATLGLIFIMAGTAIHFNQLGVTARATGVVIFIIITAPISAHMIARAAYITGTSLWSETTIDELQGQYNPETHDLQSPTDETANPN